MSKFRQHKSYVPSALFISFLFKGKFSLHIRTQVRTLHIHIHNTSINTHIHGGSGVLRGGWGFKPPPSEIPKALQNRTKLNPIVKTVKITEFMTPKPLDVRKKGSKIPKLPLVHNCFTLAVTNKLVVIIKSLKVPKIKKYLLYEIKFLVPNYSCLQNP